MKTCIELKANDQHLAIRKMPVIASGGQEEVELVFSFSSEWDDYIRMAVFTRVDDGDKIRNVKVILREDKCTLPYEIYDNPGSFFVGAYGVLGESVKTSTYINIEVSQGAATEGSSPNEVTPNIFAQYAEQIEEDNREILAEMQALIDELTEECVSDERIAGAVADYLDANPTSSGKSAYEYAVEGGYSGTESEFAEKLAAEYLSEESDPTVPAWAKASTKPSYSKADVGLGNVENVKQYSASNPPPYPVTSVNGQTGEVTLGMSDLSLGYEKWTFTLEDGSMVEKLVTLYDSNAAPT